MRRLEFKGRVRPELHLATSPQIILVRSAEKESCLNSRSAHTRWAIVLAGGEGTRVRAFLQQLCGGRGIKQFCVVVGRQSMLEHTLDARRTPLPARSYPRRGQPRPQPGSQ